MTESLEGLLETLKERVRLDQALSGPATSAVELQAIARQLDRIPDET